MAGDDAFLTIATAAERIARRELSPVELTKSCLARIARIDHRLDSFLLLRAEAALAEAAAAEREIAAGRYRGALAGNPGRVRRQSKEGDRGRRRPRR